MTPTQSMDVCKLLLKLYPWSCEKWTPEQWDVLKGELARIEGLDAEQCDAVLKNYCAEHERLTIPTVIAALKGARQFKPLNGRYATRNTRVDYYRREMMANGWGHDMSDGEVLAHVCRWWAGKWDVNSAIAHCIDVAKDVVDEERAFALVRHVFGDAGCEYIQTLLDDRARRIREGIERRKKGGARSFIEETMQWC